MVLKNISEQRQSETETIAVEHLSIDRILCPLDFSEFSRRALRYAISLTRHFGAQLYIQHTAEIPQSLLMTGAEPSAIQEWRGQLPRIEQDVRQVLEDSGVEPSEARIVVNEGPVLDRILETISSHHIDLLVMGTHGHQGFRRFVLGSVAEATIHQAPCPVLVVSRPQREFAFPEAADKVQLGTILLATDFSAYSDRALIYALRWACEWAAKVVLFHAVPDTSRVDLFPEYNPYFEKQAANAWQKIRHLVPEMMEPWCEVSYEVRHGSPKDEILRLAEERSADLIILGARGSGLTASPWGSVSSAIVRAGRFPVLVVRELHP